MLSLDRGTRHFLNNIEASYWWSPWTWWRR